jgi:O-antigen/teichoic acid export membrane protein
MRTNLSIFRHGVNHLGSAVAGKLVPIASIFIFSHMMSVSDYGMLSLFTSYVWIFAITLSLNLHTALGRYVYLPNGDLPLFLGTLQMVIGVMFVLGATVILLAENYVNLWTGLPEALLPLLLAVVASQLAESLLTQWAIYRQESTLLVRAVAIKAVMTLVLAISMLLVMPSERFFAVAGADAALSICMLAYITGVVFRKETRWRFQWSLLAYAIRYSLPLIPYTLSITLLAQIDRLMIDRYFGNEATGLYSLAFNIGMLFSLVMTAILNAINPRFFSNMTAQRYDHVVDDGRGAFGIAFTLALVLVLVGPTVTSFLVPLQYQEALAIIPSIAVGGLFSVMFLIWGRFMHFKHLTGLLSIIAVACVLLKVAVNLLVLPIWGWQAAALSTIISYAAMAILTVIVVNWRGGLFILPFRLEFTLSVSLAAIAALLQDLHISAAWDVIIRLVIAIIFLWPVKNMLTVLCCTSNHQH